MPSPTTAVKKAKRPAPRGVEVIRPSLFHALILNPVSIGLAAAVTASVAGFLWLYGNGILDDWKWGLIPLAITATATVYWTDFFVSRWEVDWDSGRLNIYNLFSATEAESGKEDVSVLTNVTGDLTSGLSTRAAAVWGLQHLIVGNLKIAPRAGVTFTLARVANPSATASRLKASVEAWQAAKKDKENEAAEKERIKKEEEGFRRQARIYREVLSERRETPE